LVKRRGAGVTRKKRDYLSELKAAERADRTKAAKYRRRRTKKELSKTGATESRPGVIRVRGEKKVGDSKHVYSKSGRFKKRTSKPVSKHEAVLVVKIKSKFIGDSPSDASASGSR
jgi:hypothetical protein